MGVLSRWHYHLLGIFGGITCWNQYQSYVQDLLPLFIPSSKPHFLASPLNNRKLTARTMALASPPPLRVDANRFFMPAMLCNRQMRQSSVLWWCELDVGSNRSSDKVCSAAAFQQCRSCKVSLFHPASLPLHPHTLYASTRSFLYVHK